MIDNKIAIILMIPLVFLESFVYGGAIIDSNYLNLAEIGVNRNETVIVVTEGSNTESDTLYVVSEVYSMESVHPLLSVTAMPTDFGDINGSSEFTAPDVFVVTGGLNEAALESVSEVSLGKMVRHHDILSVKNSVPEDIRFYVQGDEGQLLSYSLRANRQGVLTEKDLRVSPHDVLFESTDLNGDFHDDVSFQNASNGSVVNFYSENDGFGDGDVIVNDQEEWIAVTWADFDGDEVKDLFWQHRESGEILVWYFDTDFAYVEDEVLELIESTANLIEVADFNQDGFQDFLLEQDGQYVVQLLIGRDFSESVAIKGISDSSRVIEVRDLNNDGYPDLFLDEESVVYLKNFNK